MKPLKPIVTDTYDFPTLIKRGYVYVDKTALLHRDRARAVKSHLGLRKLDQVPIERLIVADKDKNLQSFRAFALNGNLK